MSQMRIQMGHPYGQTPPNIYGDFEWIRCHQKELLAKYGESSIIVYKEQVLGVGPTYAAALADAELHVPAGEIIVTPVHERLRDRSTSVSGYYRETKQED